VLAKGGRRHGATSHVLEQQLESAKNILNHSRFWRGHLENNGSRKAVQVNRPIQAKANSQGKIVIETYVFVLAAWPVRRYLKGYYTVD
jgi:hypothetical protein